MFCGHTLYCHGEHLMVAWAMTAAPVALFWLRRSARRALGRWRGRRAA
jgi:hypothetical protein